MTARTIRDILENQGFVTVPSEMPVSEVAALMKSRGIGAISVLDGSQLVGIFTERDALFRVAAAGLDPKDTTVAAVMTPNPKTISADKPFTDALEVMHTGQFRHVPVLDDGELIGMVSSRDAMGPELEQFMYAKILDEQTRDVLA
tara:strand:+ start:214 stop:648 length:435 start_codon:yes stop_codon:yes gene_type:complete